MSFRFAKCPKTLWHSKLTNTARGKFTLDDNNSMSERETAWVQKNLDLTTRGSNETNECV